MAMTNGDRVVVKLGGSLLEQPNLGTRLIRLLTDRYSQYQVSVLVGGGEIIEAIRRLDQVHQLDPSAIHWLCIDALRTTFDLLSMLMPDAKRVDTCESFQTLQTQTTPGIHLVAIDAFYSHSDQDELPYSWSTTSDSLAALLAQRLNTKHLCLIKSCDVPTRLSLVDAAARGYVDSVFPNIAARLEVVFDRLPD